MWPKNKPSESTASLVSDVTTIGLSEEKPSEGEHLLSKVISINFDTLLIKYLNALDLGTTISPLLGQSGLCDLICISTNTFETITQANFCYSGDLGTHPFIFNGYAQGQPRPDVEYELRLISPPSSMSNLSNTVGLIRENKRIRLINGPREKECCHGWLRDCDQRKVVERVLTELGQVKLPKAGETYQDTKGKTAKVIATVLSLEVVGVPDVLNDEPIFQQAHTVKGTPGGFVSAAFDTRNLLNERGLVGLLDWKVV